MGRHSTYTDEIAQEICERLATGEPLAQICRDEGMPHTTTVYDWRTANEDFALRFARAREDGFDQIAMDALDIADDNRSDTIKRQDGSQGPDSEWISRSRLRVETRLKLLAKWDPKRYGERVTHAGDADAPVHIRQTLEDADAVARSIASIVERTGTPGVVGEPDA